MLSVMFWFEVVLAALPFTILEAACRFRVVTTGLKLRKLLVLPKLACCSARTLLFWPCSRAIFV